MPPLAAHAALAALPATLMGAPDAAAQPTQAMVIHHVPLAGGGPDGTPNLPMAGRTAVWASRAGLALRWEPVPFKRSLQELQRNRQPMCVLGVFDTPERRRFARFSLPIYQEEQQVFLAASPVAAQLRLLPSAEAALLDARFKLLVYDGVAYGRTLDAWIAQRNPPPLRASAGTSGLATMLARGRVDFTISVDSELREMQSRGLPDAAAIETVLMPGMPAPPMRHLACSQLVPAGWLARLDAAIAADPNP